MTTNINDQLVLIVGESATGKSASLRNLENVIYMNCEAGKRLPFKPKNFLEGVITDPEKVYTTFVRAESLQTHHTIVVDGLNFLMDMYESLYVVNADDGRSAWNNYNQYFKNLMQQYVAKSSKSVVFIAHAQTLYNEQAMAMEVKVPIKGGLRKNQGVEPYFSCIVSAKKKTIAELEVFPEHPYLNITAQERALGFKHVLQVQPTGDTIKEVIRSPMGLFEPTEIYIDNDINIVLNKLKTFYS